MALVKCPDCEKWVSDSAPVCIGCGKPMQTSTIAVPKGTETPSQEMVPDTSSNNPPGRMVKGKQWFKVAMYGIIGVIGVKVLFAFMHPDPGKKIAEALVLFVGWTILLAIPAFIIGCLTGKSKR